MRELKFRAWDKYYKMWAYKDGKVNKPNCEYSDESEYYYDDEWYPFSDVKVIRQFELNIKKYEKQIIIEQYTGLKDKNGKEIYEGDIVNGNFSYARNGIVVWDKNRCGFFIDPIDGLGRAGTDKYYKMNSAKLEIAGNIHETPNYWRQNEQTTTTN